MGKKKVGAPVLFESEADAQRRRDANYDNSLTESEQQLSVVLKKEEIDLVATTLSGDNTKSFRISQSMMKAVRAYLDGGDCGLVIKEKYIKGRLFDDASKAMKLGTYFEYILTGSLPKNGKVPQAEYMKSVLNANEKIVKNGGVPKELTIADMYEPYREAHANKDMVLKMWAEMGLEIAKGKDGKPLSGWTIVKGRFVGTIDVVLRATKDIVFADGFTLKEGDLISADLKYSGLKDDRWSVHGWQWTPEQKRYHGTQAKHYKMLTGLEQTFWIVDPKGNYVLFFRCVIDEQAIDAHIDEANELYKRLIELDELESLEPRPEVNKCADCVLFSECNFKHTFPHPVAVDLNN